MSKRLYPHNRICYWQAYGLDDICALFKDKGLHIQTVRKWTKNGLQTIDSRKPTLIYGYVLIEFLKRQNGRGKCKTAFNRFFCMKCKDERPAFQNKIQMERKDYSLKVKSLCRICKKPMFKNYSLDDLGKLKRAFRPVDVLELYDDEISTVKTHIPAQNKNTANESQQMDLFS